MHINLTICICKIFFECVITIFVRLKVKKSFKFYCLISNCGGACVCVNFVLIS